ncbi:hypothetical protein CQ13_37475 [Bradyrhizobium retamae]|uniref:Uncharacterized protein n=1 Tax=Bradyrhizobium retamae TaxID=1300035 RepID=A0A0R3M515_9BRAD|nr:hypothetical protein CQ13_37475 [Bradyrhizobium retamae]
MARDRESELLGSPQSSINSVRRGTTTGIRRSSYLQKIAAGLEAAGVPVLNLGHIFEREEIRDLLSLLSFASEPHCAGLMYPS